jgi:hypothetical protein
LPVQKWAHQVPRSTCTIESNPHLSSIEVCRRGNQ